MSQARNKDSAAQVALHHYVTQCRERLRLILERLQWTEDGVLQQHHPLSQQKAKGQTLPDSGQDSKHSVQVDEDTLQQLLQLDKTALPSAPAVTFDDLQAQFSAEQKLIIYQHVLAKSTRQPAVFEDNAAFAEMVAVTKREQKKQRRHRKSKPTLNEELHQLVELQMQALQRQQQERRQRSRSPVQDRRRERYRQRPRSRSRDRERHRYYHKRRLSRSRSRSRSRHRSSHKKYR